uniref:Uncharacterized protein n=1 Tax=Palpitomonas bilix TaxID=652834 RepID=A0A7S3D7Z3_9EUKA|mmetsp:Transcript_26178/g.66515  ORF Transcript_26178/g.66515 Transcript_26178/m.66515 type:complete len:532 (+) Transcript_26178:31-1626(+)|eukprot:CAMPEP_0113879840 /NCGR_PEP_ID=MMETSP0780_2-20120614/7454_1 /TAXON_ID=652834 /ORGANISM="Palpitomonas bilix" /LENGTH=531 /DNA_ID=CAMNT_0000866451 /DNA_START=272 /DNA_END=1867 /DNA_ORIENTATION=- /assembly_acc=CAM_ASM_000599
MALEYQGPMMYKSGLGGWKDVHGCIQLSRHAPNAVFAVIEKNRAKPTPSGSVIGRVKSLYTLGAGFKVERSSSGGKRRNSLFEHLEAKVTAFVSGKKSTFSIRIAIEERAEEWIQHLEAMAEAFQRGEKYENPFPATPQKKGGAPPRLGGEVDGAGIPVAAPVTMEGIPSAEAAVAAYPLDTPAAKAFTAGVDNRFFAFIRPLSGGDMKEGWEKYHCIQQAGCVYAYTEEFLAETPISDTIEPDSAYLIVGTTLDFDEKQGCWKWSNYKHTAYFYPAEGGDVALPSIIEETRVLADEWVAGCLASAFGPSSLGKVGMVQYNRLMFNYAKAAFDAWVERGDEKASVADKKVWEACLADMDDALTYLFSNIKEGELLYHFPKEEGAPPSIHRIRYCERTESEIKAGKTPLYFMHMFPHSNRKNEVVELWRKLRENSFVGPMFALTPQRMDELREKFPMKMNMNTRMLLGTGTGALEKGAKQNIEISVKLGAGVTNMTIETSKREDEIDVKRREEMKAQEEAEEGLPVAKPVNE